MTTTAEAPARTRPEPKGPTELQNIRVPRDLWDAAAEPCKRIAGKGGRSKVARDALQAVVDRESDPVWQELTALAIERETTPEALQRYVVEQYLAKVKRDRAAQRKRRTASRTT